MRALCGLAEDDPAERDWPADHDGSAKVALIGIDRSQTAWLDLVDVGMASPEDVAKPDARRVPPRASAMADLCRHRHPC